MTIVLNSQGGQGVFRELLIALESIKMSNWSNLKLFLRTQKKKIFVQFVVVVLMKFSSSMV